MTSAPSWCSSQGIPTSRNKDAVVELHRRFFVENQGMSGVNELIEARCKEALEQDRRMAREHRGKLRKLHEDFDEKLKSALVNGSTSIWTQEERQRLETARHDPQEVRAKLTKELREVTRSFRQAKGAMTERVRQRPCLNVWSKEDAARLAAAKGDEVTKKLGKQLKEQGAAFQDEKKAMLARIAASPRRSFWSEEKKAEMQEIRQESCKLRQDSEKQLREAKLAWQENKKAMMEKVRELPSLSFRDSAELKELSEAKRDPQQTKKEMLQHMHDLERTARAKKAAMLEKLQNSPRKTFWTAEEREALEVKSQLR